MATDPAHESLPERSVRLSRQRVRNDRLAAIILVAVLSFITIMIALPASEAGDPGPAAWHFWVYWWMPGSVLFWSLVVAVGSRFLPWLRDRDRERDVRLHQAIETALAPGGDPASALRPGLIVPNEYPSLDVALQHHALATGRTFGIAIERLPTGLPGSRLRDACLVMTAEGDPAIRLGHQMLAECTSAQLLAVVVNLECRWMGARSAREADAQTLALTRDPSALLSALRFSRAQGAAGGAELYRTIWFSQEDERTLAEHGDAPDRLGELSRHLREPA